VDLYPNIKGSAYTVDLYPNPTAPLVPHRSGLGGRTLLTLARASARGGGPLPPHRLHAGDLVALKPSASKVHCPLSAVLSLPHCVSHCVFFTVSPTVSSSLCLPMCLPHRASHCVFLTVPPTVSSSLCLPLCLPHCASHCVFLTVSPTVSSSLCLPLCLLPRAPSPPLRAPPRARRAARCTAAWKRRSSWPWRTTR
jgi:hypothetical protein